MNNYLLLFFILQAFVHVTLCVFFACKCFEEHLRFSKRYTILLAGAFIIISILIIELFIERNAPFSQYSLLVSFIWALISISFALIAIRAKILHLLFLAFFLMNVTIKTAFLSKQIESLNVFPPGDISYILVSITILATMVPFVWYLLVVLFKKVINLNLEDTYAKWIFILPLAYFILHRITGSDFFVSQGWVGFAALLISNVAIYLSYVAVLHMFLSMHRSFIATSNAQLSQQMIVMQKDQYKQITDNIEKATRMEHDFRHHLMVIKNFADNDNLDELKSYLDNYAQPAILVDDVPVCNHALVDVLLRHYASLAKNEEISISIRVPFPHDFQVADDDMVVLFGNLLENSLESCRRQTHGDKFIKVHAKIISKSMLAIEVSNSYNGELSQKNGGFTSSKRQGTGVGLSTISVIAEQNGGSAKFSYDNGVFTSQILLVTKESAN